MTGSRRMLRVFSWPCLRMILKFTNFQKKRWKKLIFFLLLQLLFCCRQQTDEQLWNRVQVSCNFKGWSFLQMEFRTKILRSPKWWVEVTIKQPTTAGTKSEEKARFTVMFSDTFSAYSIHLESFFRFPALFPNRKNFHRETQICFAENKGLKVLLSVTRVTRLKLTLSCSFLVVFRATRTYHTTFNRITSNRQYRSTRKRR